MSIVLTHGYFLSEDPKEQEIMRPYPPLGILYLSAFLKEKGKQVLVIDTTFISKDQWRKEILHRSPRILAFYVNLMTRKTVLENISWMRTQAELASCTVILGGPDVRYNAANYLAHGANVLVVGEGEETMLELSSLIETNEDWSTCQGIAYVNAEGETVFTEERGKLKDLNELPVPDREAIQLEQYLEAWQRRHGEASISVSTQRGCPYTCQWCSTAVYGMSYRRRSPSSVIGELKHLVHRYQCNTFWFVDDVFTVSHKWIEEFAALIKEENLIIRFECITRADRLTENILQRLKESGCHRIWIGAESGSQRILDAMDRRVQANQVQWAIQHSQAIGISAGTFIMLGYPGETKADIEATIEHLKKSDPDYFTITVAYPIKGTGLFEQVKEKLILRKPWHEGSDRDTDFPRTYPRKFYDIAVRRVVNEVKYHQLLLRQKSWNKNVFKHWWKYQASKWWMRMY
ncbi:MAG: B12-binding domain-containing radical SAM protein [Cytophagaceae bacterium]|jgi:radical SAM superfamily enzyme YgiQ (UPF0313 family)|nr:B12-binding domain-containing radical SAM protein [Cytophagaceae bacterium]